MSLKGIAPITVIIILTIILVLGIALYKSDFVQSNVLVTSTATTTLVTNPVVIEGVITADSIGYKRETWGIVMDNGTSYAFDLAKDVEKVKPYLGKRVRALVSEIVPSAPIGCGMGKMDYCISELISFEEIKLIQ